MEASRTILLIDDSPTIRCLIKIFLKGGQYEFLEAEEGGAALALLRTRVVHLVLVDVEMPGVDGLEFLRRLRSDSNPAIGRLPVVLLTADRDPDIGAKGLAAGANAVLMKPVSGPDLMAHVTRFLPVSES